MTEYVTCIPYKIKTDLFDKLKLSDVYLQVSSMWQKGINIQ
jgi:hypothetical protein